MLAKLAAVPVSSVSLFERGKRRPSLETLIRLAEVLMVSIDYLVGRTENPLAHVNVEGDGRAVTRLWRREEIEQIEDYLDYVKSQDNYRVDPETEPE